MADVAEFRDFRLVEKHQSWTMGGPVVSRLPDPEIATLEGRASATMAEPATFALFGFATGTWIAGVVFGGFVAATAEPALAVILILFAGIGQFVGGLFALRRVNALSASAFCCFGAYNTVVGLTILLEGSGLVPKGVSTFDVLSWFNFSFGFIAFAFTLASLRSNMVLPAVLFFLGCGYTLIGVSLLHGVPPGATVGGGIPFAGGVVLWISAALAYYYGMAMVVNATWNRVVLPIVGNA